MKSRWVPVALALFAALGCGKEQICEPNATTCVSPGQPEQQTCNVDGTEQLSADPCSDGDVCTQTGDGVVCQPFVCNPGDVRCTAVGSRGREVCNAGASEWESQPCNDGEFCLNGGECLAAACAPNTGRCPTAGTNLRDLCGDGSGWSAHNCPSDQVCYFDSATAQATCKAKICNPGSKKCSDDATGVLTCDVSGGAYTQSDCQPNQACSNSACVSAAFRLGDLSILRAGTTLGPGYYSVAVADTDSSGMDALAFPVTITGAVSDPKAMPLPPFPSPSVGDASDAMAPRLRCGTPEMLRNLPPLNPNPPPTLPPEMRSYNIGDTRTFHVQLGSSTTPRTGRLRKIGTYANFWEDQTVKPAGGVISDTVLTDLVRRIDQAVVPRDVAIFGNFTDVDGNGKVDVFFTDLLVNSGMLAFVTPLMTLFPNGSYNVATDYGEVVYAMGPDANNGPAELASTIAHEMSHLITLGTRLSPYLSWGPSYVPSWVDGDVYITEGMAVVAQDWSGQSYDAYQGQSAQDPSRLSLSLIPMGSYLTNTEDNLSGYGLGALVLEYLFDQAGAVSVTGQGSIADKGGFAFIDQVTARQSGFNRITPPDGRTPDRWYPDMAAALLLTTLDGKVSAGTASNKLWQFTPTTKDPYFGGWNGATLRWEWTDYGSTGPFVYPRPWSARPTSLRRGGMSFLTVAVGSAGAQLSMSRGSVAVAVVRHAK